jgi:hypothetical protein
LSARFLLKCPKYLFESTDVLLRRLGVGGEGDDLPACIATLRDAGVTLRNELEVGPGGRQIQIEDPDGNPVELFEPASRS